jgi:thiamine-phosphate pyrophosphorylase
MNRKIGFYFITDPSLSKNGIFDDVEKAIAGGSRIIQCRDKVKSDSELLSDARRLRAITKKAGAKLIINDSIQVCIESEADGVHLGQEDASLIDAREALGNRIIGVTAHNVKEALEAEKDGADYIGASPIFATSTKDDAGAAIGLDDLRKIRAKVKLPIAAIGGITLKNAPEAIAAGANGLCAISAAAGDSVEKKVRQFVRLFP